MPERFSSFFILLGVVLVVLALWYLSVRFVRWDSRRRAMKPLEQKAWVGAAIGLPLFGFALYLFFQILQDYLSPPLHGGGGPGDLLREPKFGPGIRKNTQYSALNIDGGQAQQMHLDVKQYAPVPEPAWGKTDPAHTNGKAHAVQAPETARASYQPARTRYSLHAEQGPLEGQQFVLKSLPVRIGRGTEVGVALDADLNISRQHAEIYEWNGMLRIRDLGSMHGTLINGIAVKDQSLIPGDRITLGGTILILRELP